MFNRSARWYDAFYGGIDYASEARQVIAVIRSLNPEAGSLLDVACGTGRHLAHFRADFDCAGVDIEPGMVEVARQALPGVPVTVADMADFELGRRFDAVTCLFSAIGYMRTQRHLDQAVGTMAAHLNPGGILIVEPWITPDGWRGSGNDTADVVEHDGAKLVRVISSRRQGHETGVRMHYARAEAGEIETEDEWHHLTLFDRDQYLAAFTAAGLTAQWDEAGLRGRGLVVGVAPM